MKHVNIRLMILALAGLLAGTAQGQSQDETLRQQELEMREQERTMREAEAELEQARKRLEEAAREVAELSIQVAPEVEIIREIRGGQRAMLGVNIGSGGDSGGDGVYVAGVTPGGPADEAGLKGGDLITGVGEQSLKSDSAREANRKLLDFMRKVEPGDDVTVHYQRDGSEKQAKIRTKAAAPMAFGYATGPGQKIFISPGDAPPMNVDVQVLGDAPMLGLHGGFFRAWPGMELVTLTPGLGEYFGTSEGLLVVRSPEDESLDIKDGDVILSIDGRTPQNPGHAMRILRSYQAGEKITLQMVRKKKKRSVEIVLPERKLSELAPMPELRWHESPDMPRAPAGPPRQPVPARPAPPVTS
jgi:C-terminal processing protease CtpA/Prc